MMQILKKNLLGLLSLTSVLFALWGCEEQIDNAVAPSPEDKLVTVSLNFGFADNNSDEFSRNGSRQEARVENSTAAFNASLLPPVLTRSSTDVPDQLYNLEIRQYEPNGNYISGTGRDYGTVNIGTHLDVNLAERNDCQLVLVARGSSSAISALDSKSLSDVQNMVADKSKIQAIDPSVQGSMNAMPYVLHLPHVKVAKVNGVFMLQSIDGAYDARLLLKRLATRLTVNWSIDPTTMNGYMLKEVKLCQVPSTFRILPAKATTEWGITYPSEVSEFVDIYRLTATSDLNLQTKSVWIPANVRGTSAKATSPTFRIKENAPTAASYTELMVDNSTKNERLYYRAYLGGVESTDFNLYENTDYNWTLNIHSANYRDDRRITLLDQTPVVSTNLVSTSNCLMMQPGTNICFNPYKHEAGSGGWNDLLVNNPSSSPSVKTAIASVKVLWQTKDAGTSGDLVMGYIIDNTNHQNLVNISNASDLNNARVSVKVPVTKGGNAVVAAYAADGTTILWSWHIWISDYVPVRINNYAEYATAQTSTRNGTVHKYRSSLWKEGGIYANMVMMDRELGARSGGYSGITKGNNYTLSDAVSVQGLLYQWGRKDPFFGSADGTVNEINVIFDGYGVAKEVTNLARGNATLSNGTYLQYTIEHPLTFLYFWSGTTNSDWWDNVQGNELTEAGGANRWNAGGAVAPGKKTIYDPCPNGWKVPMRGSASAVNSNYFTGSIFDGFQSVTGGTPGYNSGGDVALSSNSTYFTYTAFNFQGTFYWKNEYSVANTGVWNNKTNPQGGRLFLLEDGITPDTPQKWTIHNTYWFPSSAERHPGVSGTLMNPSLGHNWTADGDVCGSLFCAKPNIMQLGYFGRTYGWSVRCIQDNK